MYVSAWINPSHRTTSKQNMTAMTCGGVDVASVPMPLRFYRLLEEELHNMVFRQTATVTCPLHHLVCRPVPIFSVSDKIPAHGRTMTTKTVHNQQYGQ